MSIRLLALRISNPRTRAKPQHSRSISSHPDPLFNYTSGRWLWNERSQLAARYRYFNIRNLQEAACQALGASTCTSITKIGEGNYNKAFRLEMADGRAVVAKIPHPNAGPPRITTASEVATMEFARTVLGIPVPEVFAWSANEQNSVQTEYIIMEEARGSQLHEVWDELALRKKVDVVREIVDIERKLLSVEFDRIGSLYFKDSGIEGCEAAGVITGPQDVAEHVRSKYSIGPITRREFWEGQRSDMQYHGPWTSSAEYLTSIARREIDWISTHADPLSAKETPWQYSSPQQNSPQAHIALLQKFAAAVPHMTPQDAELNSPRLWHPDFHAGNIYVDDEGRISSVIDWQAAWTAPAFIGARPPLILDYAVEMMMKLPEGFKSLDDATKTKLRYQVAQSILIHTYETCTAAQNPLMDKVLRHPHGQTLKQLEAFAGGTWDNCLFPLQECLLRVESEWEHFHTSQPCPYHFSTEELRRHDEEADTFNKSQALWKELEGVLTEEGYTSIETFGAAVHALKGLRELGLENFQGDARSQFDGETRWVASLDEYGVCESYITLSFEG